MDASVEEVSKLNERSLPLPEWPVDRPLPAREGTRASRPRWKAQFETLTAEHETLTAKHETLKEEYETVKAENEALKVRIARLGKNSSTSSKPPSSDFVKPKAEQR